jgi:hypothetical protein
MQRSLFRALALFGIPLSFATPSTHLGSVEALIQEIDRVSKSAPNLKTAFTEGESCEFASLCNRLEENVDLDAFYKSPDGGELGNFHLRGLKFQLLHCAQDLKRQAKEAASVYGASTEKRDPMKAFAEKNKEKFRSFYRSVAKNKEEALYIKLTDAMLDIDDGMDMKKGPMTPERFHEVLTKAEALVGAKVSEETRNAWAATYKQESFLPFGEMPMALGEDPFEDVRLLSEPDYAGGKEKVLAHQAKFQERLDKSYDVFRDTQARILKVLEGRKTPENAAQIDSMLKRIRDVRMNPPPTSWAALQNTGCSNGPNAYYDPMSHSFTLCPSIMNFPASTLQAIVAHELGHAIDPCTCSFHLSEIHGEERYPQVYAGMGGGFMGNFMNFEPKLPEQRSTRLASYEQSTVERFAAEYYKSPAVRKVAEAVGLPKNPLGSVISCLEDPRSVGARTGDVGVIRSKLEQRLAEMKAAGVAEGSPEILDLQNRLANLEKNWADHTACSFVPSAEDKGNSQMQEAFADWISTQVIASKVTEAKTQDEKSRVAFEASAHLGAMGDCRNFQGRFQVDAQKALRAAGCTKEQSGFMSDLGAMRQESGQHPASHKRISKIVMANPAIQGALGCRRKGGVKNCE